MQATRFILFGYLLLSSFLVRAHATSLPIDEKNNAAEDVLYNPDGKWALIAGGSKGIGYGIAQALAKRNYNLVLVARHQKSLDSSAELIRRAYKVQVRTLSQDLSKEEAPQNLLNFCEAENIPLNTLCNVAGMGGDDDYLQLAEDEVQYMLRLNLEAPIMLTQKLLPLLEKNAPGYVLNVASMAGFAPMPTKNVYSSSKAGLIAFSYNLRYQLKEKKISVSVLAPGPVYTKPSIVEETRKQMGKFGDWMALQPDFVGEKTVQRMMNKRLLIVPGTLAKGTGALLRTLPKRLVTAIYWQLGKGKK